MRNKNTMKIKWLALVLAAYTPVAAAQEVVIFGDSLSDVGQKGWADLPAPNTHLKASYLKADGSDNLLYGEHLAQALGGSPHAAFPLNPATAAGSNYAHSGGVVVGSNSPHNVGINPKVDMDKQIDAYLASGKAGGNHLHVLWGGGNDMAAILKDAAAHLGTPAAQTVVLDRTAEAAAASAGQWQRLQAAGVGLVVAPDVPNVLYTPELFDQFAKAFGEQLNQRIRSTGAFGSGIVGAGAKREVEKSYARHIRDALNSSQQNLVDFQNERTEILDKVVEDLWAARPPLPASWIYSNYGAIFAANGVTKDGIKNELNQTYGQFAAAATQATDLLNLRTTAALNASGGNVVRLGVNQLFGDMLSDPAKYGFDNTVGRACNDHSATTLCGVGLSGAGTQAANANADKMLFADSFHPGPKAHRIMSDYLLATLNAPADMGGLKTVAAKGGEAAWDFLREDGNRLRGIESEQAADAVAAYGRDGDGGTLYAGGHVRLNPNWRIGMVFSRQEQERRFGQTRIDARTNSLTSVVRYDTPQWWLGGMVQLNDSDYKTARHIRLGAADLVQNGETGGSSLGAGLFGGYQWQRDALSLGVTGDVMLLRGKVGGFGEQNSGATQMQFGTQRYTALRSGLGVEAAYRLGDWQPYAAVRLVRYRNGGDAGVEAGMNGSKFRMPAVSADGNRWDTRLGMQWQPQHLPWRAFVQVGRNFGGGNSRTAVQMGVGGRF